MAKKSKKSKKQLPNELIITPNKDKEFHEKWSPKRNILDIPHPFRCCLLGSPGVGKGVCVKNMIVRAKPEFEEIYIIHPDAEYTKEWEDVDAFMLSEIPSPSEFEGKVKTLIVIDDLELKNLSKEQKTNLDRLFGYVSTHKNISVMCTLQDAFNCPPSVRRCTNLFILWRVTDMDSLAMLSRKVGMSCDEFKYIFKHICKEHHDSLWIDQTKNTPYPLRKNGFELLQKDE